MAGNSNLHDSSKSLTATCYAASPFAQMELGLFGEDDLAAKNAEDAKSQDASLRSLRSLRQRNRGRMKQPYKVVITEVKDENGDGRIDLADVEWLIKNKKNVLTKLKYDGDFRSAECVALLDEADVVVPTTFMSQYNPDQFEIVGATESEGVGFSAGLWRSESETAQPLIGGIRKYKRIFIRRRAGR